MGKERMKNVMEDRIAFAKEQVGSLIRAALNRAMETGALPQADLPEFVVEIPADKANGDVASNVAMAGARVFRRSPQVIAQAVREALELEGTCFERAEVAGPGFLNFFLSPSWFAGVVAQAVEAGEAYGRTSYGKGEKVLVEFVSANPTGPMHIGNARGGAIGDCLASVLGWAGYEAHREFYVNDAGNQINKFGLSLEARYLQLYQEGVEMPEDAYLGGDITAHAKAFAELHGDKYVDAPSEERRKALVDFALPKNIRGLEEDLEKYRIVYDKWFLESTIHASGEVQKVLDILREKGCTYEKDGAEWFKGEPFGTEDFVLVRSNGVPTYVVPDIAYHYNKLVTRGYDRAINVLGADHHGYVFRLKATLKALGLDPERLQVVLMQMVRLVREGQVVKASKRSGKAITLATLLEEVPIDAARFYFNLREASSQFDFDLDLAVEQSSQNPVYYVQYAHARICSIFKNLAAEGIAPRACSEAELCRLDAPEEIALIRQIALLPGEVTESAKNCDPARITRYSMELATQFHKFYNSCRVKSEDEPLMQARLTLCKAAQVAVRNALAILKITCPETM